MQSKGSIVKDVVGVAGFIATVVVGALLINTLLFRSYSVTGPSMESTLRTGDRLIVSRLPITFSHISGKEWVPQRGEIVVFKNPLHVAGQPDKFLVKRVIGLPKEQVTVKNGTVTIYNQQNPDGLNPDRLITGPSSPTSGDISMRVPPDEVFVIGDNRSGNASFDSRSGLGTIPLDNLLGSVSMRVYPLQKIRFF